jgi:hypothetical protein
LHASQPPAAHPYGDGCRLAGGRDGGPLVSKFALLGRPLPQLNADLQRPLKAELQTACIQKIIFFTG